MNLKQTKQKLTVFFLLVVFLIVLVFSLTGSIVKYKSDLITEQKNFSLFIKSFEGDEKKIRIFLDRENIFERRQKNGKNPAQKFSRGREINYIVKENGRLKKSFVRENISDDMVEYLLNNNKKNGIHEEKNSFFIKKFQFENREYIFFKRLHYNLEDLFDDIFLFTIIDLIFCVLLYFIGKKFINRVFVPVEENMADMKNFVHNAGHELKTPITVMDSNLQLLLEEKKYSESMLSEMKQELGKMNELIDSLVNLSDISRFKTTTKNNLQDTIEEILKNFSSDIQQKNLSITTQIPENIFVEAKKNYLQIFLSNLIKNAIKYNKQDGNIAISYEKKYLKLTDTGIGIDKKNLPKIFDRFYREEQARSQSGFGIGLSLVKKIADMYAWKLEVNSEKNEGTEVKLKF